MRKKAYGVSTTSYAFVAQRNTVMRERPAERGDRQNGGGRLWLCRGIVGRWHIEKRARRESREQQNAPSDYIGSGTVTVMVRHAWQEAGRQLLLHVCVDVHSNFFLSGVRC